MSTETAAKVFTSGDPEPDCSPGTIAVVNLGEYRYQEVWVCSGANIGNWYLLGNEYRAWAGQRLPSGVPQHPTWDDVTARGPVTLMVPTAGDAYEQGWNDGRARLLEQIESLRYDEER